MATFDNIQTYLRALRINYANSLETKNLWKYLGGFLEMDYIISLDSERKALQLLSERLLDLRTMDMTEETEEYQDALFTRFSYGFSNVTAWLSDFALVNSEQFCLLEGQDKEEYLTSSFSALLSSILLNTEDPVTLEEHIDMLLVGPVLGHYMQYSLSPFLLHRLCDDIAHNNTLFRYQVIGNVSITFPASDSIDGLYSLRRVLTHANWSYFQDLQLVDRFMDLNQNFFLHPETSCNVELRHMMITNGWNDTNMHKTQNPYGGGALSTRELLCCSHSQELMCIPFGPLIQSHYNSVIMAAALALATPPKSSPSKMLSIGLGGGELHVALLAYFAQMDVYSVDISSEVVHMAWEQFGMKHFVCDVHYLENGNFAPYTSLHNNAVQGRTKYTHAHLKNPNCLSHIVIADIWELIDNLFDAKTNELSAPMPVSYDVVVFDAFDAATTSWTAEAYKGESNLRTGYAIQSLNKLRDLLTEDGTAVFHMHKDKNFLPYVNMLKDVFGDKKVAVFDVSMLDSIVVAAKSVFFPHLHEYVPQSAPQQCDEVDIDFTSVQQCNYLHSHSGEESANDFSHPCEHPQTFHRNLHNVVDALDFPRQLRYASYHALNCTGFV
eukprot:gene30677-37069_t